jgi:hypothetical protein
VILNSDVPVNESYRTPAAMKRFHQAVIQLPTIQQCAELILKAGRSFDKILHWHGTDDKFLDQLGNTTPVMDLGKVFEQLMKPVREHFTARGEKIKLSQEVACILLGGKWLNPHLAENDALMLSDCFLRLSKLLAAAASLSFSELSQITSFSQLL